MLNCTVYLFYSLPLHKEGYLIKDNMLEKLRPEMLIDISSSRY